MALVLIFYIIQRLSDIFKHGLCVQILLWPLWRTNMYLVISLFSMSSLWLCHPSPLSGGFTFFELMKRGVPLHLIDKYMNESEKSESEKKGSNWRLIHPMITQKSLSLLQIMAHLSLAWYALFRHGSIVRKVCVCHCAIV